MLHYHYYYLLLDYLIIFLISYNSNSKSSSSTSSTIIIIIIMSSSSINKISVILTISTSIFELFICFTTVFLRTDNRNKVRQLFCVIITIAPYGEAFCHNLQFNEFIFVYIANIGFICDGQIYLLTDWLAGWLAGWLADWLTDWLT